MNNLQTCCQWVLDQGNRENVSVLDYGCGQGALVKELRACEIEAFGCDIFYDGGDYSPEISTNYFDSGIIKRMANNSIPFENSSFDFVINKMVMEHVDNLETVLEEIHRVLKPGGMILSIFPDKGVWHEGHCGVPFLHRFSKGGRGRVYYASMWRALGVGYHTQNKSIMQWSRDFCEWLDKWTHYRTRQEIHTIYSRCFADIRHIEDYWLRLRLGKLKSFADWLPTSIQKGIVQKLSTLVFVAQKPTSERVLPRYYGHT